MSATEPWTGQQLVAWVRWRREDMVARYAGVWREARRQWAADVLYGDPDEEAYADGVGPRSYVLPAALMKWTEARDEAVAALRAGELAGILPDGCKVGADYWLQHRPDGRPEGAVRYKAQDVRRLWPAARASKPKQDEIDRWICDYMARRPGAKRDIEVFPACRRALPGATFRQMGVAMKAVPDANKRRRGEHAKSDAEIVQAIR
jgi:hypothetical protein